jgi:hypothetical protein
MADPCKRIIDQGASHRARWDAIALAIVALLILGFLVLVA